MNIKVSFFFSIFLTLVIAGCSSGGGGAHGSPVPSDLQGQWLYVHSGQSVYLGERTSINYSVVDNNLLEVTESNNTYYLIRAGIQDVQVTGKISSLEGAASAFAGVYGDIGGIDVILTNLQDSSVTSSATTDTNGNFSTAIPSGSYQVEAVDTAGNSVQTTVTVSGTNNDLGEFTVVSGELYNFKTEIGIRGYPQPDSQYSSELAKQYSEYVYFGTLDGQNDIIYEKSLYIVNIGNQAVSGLSFQLSLDDTDVKQFSYENVLGGMDVGGFLEILITMSFKRPISEKTLQINVTITDINNQTWHDHVGLTLTSHIPVSVTLRDSPTNTDIDNSSKGYLITPGRKPFWFPDHTNSLRIPYIAGDSYEFVASTPSVSSETAYSIDFGRPINYYNSAFDNFTQTGINEPDNSYAQATTLNLYDSQIAYLHGGDIDYYDLTFDSITTPFDPNILGKVSYVDINSNEMETSGDFVYVAAGPSGLQVLNVSEPTLPDLIATLSELGAVYNVSVAGNYAYLSTYPTSTARLDIVDVTTPSAPNVLGGVDIPGSISNISVIGDYAYIAASTSGLKVVDVSDPYLPSIEATLLPIGDNGVINVDAVGNYAYTIETHYDTEFGWSAQLRIIDISNPLSPNALSSHTLSDGYSHYVHIVGDYAYVTGGSRLEIINISAPNNPVTESTLYLNDTGAAGMKADIEGSYLYVPIDANGVDVIDISNSSAPEIHYTFNLADSNNYSITGNYVYVTDSDGYFKVIQLKP